MNKKILVGLILLILLSISVSSVFAGKKDAGADYPWRDHAAPMVFKFENMIDTHQQSLINGKGVLQGFIYIQPTGVTNGDYGVLEAQKANCNAVDSSCIIGWVVKGVWVEGAKLVNLNPRIWLINESQIPKEPGYSHFQWFEGPPKPHGLEVWNESGDTTYDGYLMKRIAPAPFFWLGGSGSGGGGGGGCGGHTELVAAEDGCDDGGDDGCGGEGDDHGGGSPGRYVQEGVDSHSNVVTESEWDGTWHGGCSHD